MATKKKAPEQRSEPSLAAMMFRHASQETRYSSSVDDTIHVTDLFELCPREYFLLRQYGLKRTRVTSPSLRALFRMGKAYELSLVDDMRLMGILGSDQVVLKDEKLGIVGHCDVALGNGKLVEIKAKNPAIFRLTKREPLARDKFQCEVYLWLSRHQEMILFTATWGGVKMPYRDHNISFNLKTPELVKKIVLPIREAQAGKKWPPRVCGSKEDPRAQLCPVADYCFAYPSGKIKTIKEMVGE